MNEEKIAQFKQWIDNSDNVVFFGGAGVSTESGIPDFRSVDGLYNQSYDYPPETILSHTFYIRKPEEFFRFYRDKMLFPDAEPSMPHIKLAELEQCGKLKGVITQNIDGLHQKAGSRHVIELHGSVLRNYCERCGEFYGLDTIINSEGGLSEGGRTGAEYLEKNIFRPIALTFIRLCVFMAVYVLMEIVIRLILRLSGVFTRMAGLTAANRFAGMALGLCKGGLYLVLIAFMVCTVINATENKLPKFNSAVFENTYLFSYFFDILYK